MPGPGTTPSRVSGPRRGRRWPGSQSARMLLNGLTVLHLGKNFDVIADVTGQPVERLNVR